MRTALALGLLAVARIAWAKPPELVFIQLAPTRDGGAWALVRVHDDIAIRRVAPDGSLAATSVPTDRAIRAIATSPFDDSLWALTRGPVLERAPDGAWRRVMLPPEPEWRGWTSASLAPIGPHRAVVVRSCGDACSDVAVIEAGASSAEPTRLDQRLGPSVADGRGGLWAIAPGGYVHFHDGRWDTRTEIAATAITGDGRGGAIVANDHELATIDADGNVTSRGPLATRCTPRGVIAAADEALVVCADTDRSLVLHVALAPIREQRVERIPTPTSWRADGGVAVAGARPWLVTADAIIYRSNDGWKTIAGRGPEKTRKVLASAPFAVGLATRPSAANGISVGLRPEVILPFDDFKYPIYGVGPYVEAVVAHGAHVEGLFGGGVTGIVYGDMWAASLSAGADARYGSGSTHPQLAISAFVGLREYNGPWFDLPLGLRVDARPGTESVPGSVTFSLAVDAGWFVALAAYALGHRD